MSERIFLVLADDWQRERVHGVDYLKGLTDEPDGPVVRECGRKHEYQTRRCRPVFLTEEEVERLNFPEDEVVEAIPFTEHLFDKMMQAEKEEAR